MANPFKIPFRERGTPRDRIFSILIFGLFIFLFLYFFKPFGISTLNSTTQFFITLGFGLVTTFVLLIFNFLIEPIICINNWTLGKSILWDIFIASSIGTANYFYISLIFPQVFIFKYFLLSIWTAILVGSIPVTIRYIISFNRIYRKALDKASIAPEEISWESEVLIRAGNPKNEFRVNPKQVVYLCSNDNYVTIVTIKGGVQSKTTIRGTLILAESELGRNSRFLRCHKCYIVNLDYVEKITGNKQNMILRLTPSGTEIPVSRSKAGIVLKMVK
jgi:hypothetical protein